MSEWRENKDRAEGSRERKEAGERAHEKDYTLLRMNPG